MKEGGEERKKERKKEGFYQSFERKKNKIKINEGKWIWRKDNEKKESNERND